MLLKEEMEKYRFCTDLYLNVFLKEFIGKGVV